MALVAAGWEGGIGDRFECDVLQLLGLTGLDLAVRLVTGLEAPTGAHTHTAI